MSLWYTIFAYIRGLNFRHFYELENPRDHPRLADSLYNELLHYVVEVSDHAEIMVEAEDITIWVDPLDATREYTEDRVDHIK